MKRSNVSVHSLQRANERFSVSSSKATRLIDDAYVNGKTSEVFSGEKREFLRRKSKTGYSAKYYLGKIFIFSESGICVTTYDAPMIFERKYCHKEVLKDYYKYMKRFNCNTLGSGGHMNPSGFAEE